MDEIPIFRGKSGKSFYRLYKHHFRWVVWKQAPKKLEPLRFA